MFRFISNHSLFTILIILALCIEYCKLAPLGEKLKGEGLRQRRNIRDKDHGLDCQYEQKQQCIQLPGGMKICQMVSDKTKLKCVHDV